jgi:AraC-like DNA-binding protein
MQSLYHEGLITGRYYPRVLAYYFRQWEEFRMPPHSHDRIEIMYVISGRCVVEAEEESFLMKRGDFILLDANVRHRLTVEKESPCRMLNIEFVFTTEGNGSLPFRELAEGSPELAAFLVGRCPYLLLKDPDAVYRTLKSLVLELDEKSPENQLMIRLLFSQLFLQIARIAAESKDNAQNPADLYVRKALEYIRHNYDRFIQVKDIAFAVSIHPGYLHRIFKRALGCTVMEYLISFRVQKAKMLLAQADIPITDIPDYIGIGSRQYFSAVFRKHTGQSPLEFRKAVRKVKSAGQEVRIDSMRSGNV